MVRRLGAEIQVFQGDDLRSKDPTGLARACEQHVCVLYLKVCSPDGLACEFDWGSPPASEGRPFFNLAFWVRATSVQALAHALAALSIQRGGEGGAVVSIPISRMTVRSALPYLHPCGRIPEDRSRRTR
jgi:hypothetical protein